MSGKFFFPFAPQEFITFCAGLSCRKHGYFSRKLLRDLPQTKRATNNEKPERPISF
jgi:hypothetical protein